MGVLNEMVYDNKARPVRMRTDDYYSGYTQVDTKFNFIGNPVYAQTQHRKDGTMQPVTVKDAFTYDARERPLTHTHKIGSLPTQLMAKNTYDALGRLESKKVGGTDITGSTSFQNVDHKYNVRGWLTDINNVANLAVAGAPVDLFAFKLNYNIVENNINGAVSPLFNGNIAETFWRTSSDNIKRKYGHTYDYQNRLLDAWYQVPNTAVPLTNSYNEHLTYDTNGNILTLQRNGEQDIANSVIGIDELVYSYDDGNKLLGVRDYEMFSAGFNDGHTNPLVDDFEYDNFGNMTRDRNKDIEGVVYNHLNLPTEISFGSLGTIEYLYGATGTKLQKKVNEGDGISITDYRGGFQYTNNALDHFPTAEGYVKATSNASAGGGNTTVYNYVFNYTDHLGNIRLRYSKDPQTGQLAILEEDHYYPFGLKHKGYNAKHEVFEVSLPNTITLTPVTPLTGDSYKYKFGGKELQSELGLEMYDFGMRNYDPALGRWMNMDPLAEAMRRHSPYNYAFDNPVYFIDPDGMMPGVGGFANVDSNTSTGSFETSGGFDVNTVDKKGNILETQYHADVNDAGNAASAIAATIDHGGSGVALQSSSAQTRGDGEEGQDLLVNPTGLGIRNDAGGKGHYGAPRGSRQHYGLDLQSIDGQDIISPVSGSAINSSFVNSKGITIPTIVIIPTDANLGFNKLEILYVGPVEGGWRNISGGDVIGQSVNLQSLGYPTNVGPHVHVQMKLDKARINPTPYFFER